MKLYNDFVKDLNDTKMLIVLKLIELSHSYSNSIIHISQLS